jgi:hypothetical protein
MSTSHRTNSLFQEGLVMTVHKLLTFLIALGAATVVSLAGDEIEP